MDRGCDRSTGSSSLQVDRGCDRSSVSDSSFSAAEDREPFASTWNWAEDFPINWQKMPARLQTSIRQKQRPGAKDRREMIRILSDDILQHTQRVTRKELAMVCHKIVSTYPESFHDEDQKNSHVVGSGYDSILFQIENRIYNVKRQAQPSPSTSEDSASPPERKRQRKENYGCTKWSSPLPTLETVESQQEKMEQMKRDYVTREDIDMKEVEDTMKITYASQRKDINKKDPPLAVDVILDRWPFLRHMNSFRAHYEELTGTSADKFDEALNGRNKGYRLYQFFQTTRAKRVVWNGLVQNFA